MYSLVIPMKEKKKEIKTKRITSNILTKYEKCRLLSTRALQISNNSAIFTEIDSSLKFSALEIAKKEFQEKYNFPLSIRRVLPNGLVEDFDLDEMIIMDDS